MISDQALGEIREAYERCQRRFPTIQLPFEAFLARIEEVVGSSQAAGSDRNAQPCHPWLATFAHFHHEDLFLALACAQGDRIAWEYFADEYLPLVQRFAAQSCRNFNESEDLAQEIISTLLGGNEPGLQSKLTGYNGRGSLAGWLRVTVAHLAIDRFRRSSKQVSLEEMGERGQMAPAFANPGAPGREEERLDARWGPVLSHLLAEELGRLPARDRLLLGLYYLKGVSLKAIGEQFGVHEATASRWLESLRQGIRKRVEREMRRKYGLSPRDLRSLWRWVSEDEGLPLEELFSLHPKTQKH